MVLRIQTSLIKSGIVEAAHEIMVLSSSCVARVSCSVQKWGSGRLLIVSISGEKTAGRFRGRKSRVSQRQNPLQIDDLLFCEAKG